MPRLCVLLGGSLVAAPIDRSTLAAWYLALFGGSPNDWRLSGWQLLHDHFDRPRLSRLWRRAPHTRFAALTPERQALVTLQLTEQTLVYLANTPIQHPGDPAPRPPAPALLPWIRDGRRRLLARVRAHELAARPVSPLVAACRALAHAVHAAPSPSSQER